MKRNPNYWRLIEMFFIMAMLFALMPVDGVNVLPEQENIEYSVNSPPGVQQIAFMQNSDVVSWIAQSMPGVAISYSAEFSGLAAYAADAQGAQINYLLSEGGYFGIFKTKDTILEKRHRFPRDGLSQELA